MCIDFSVIENSEKKQIFFFVEIEQIEDYQSDLNEIKSNFAGSNTGHAMQKRDLLDDIGKTLSV